MPDRIDNLVIELVQSDSAQRIPVVVEHHGDTLSLSILGADGKKAYVDVTAGAGYVTCRARPHQSTNRLNKRTPLIATDAVATEFPV